MPGNVRNASDEKHWQAAKKKATEQYGFEKPSKDRFYAIVETIYKQMKGGAHSATEPQMNIADALDEIVARLNRVVAEQMNQPGYKWYVVDVDTRKILSGWEFQADAKDELRNQPPLQAGKKPPKVLSGRYLKGAGVDPNNDANWWQGGAPGEPEPEIDEVGVDEMLRQQALHGSWEAAIASVEVLAANPNKNEIIKGLQEIKKAFARFGELHWNDAQQFLGQKSQRLVEAVEALNEVIKALGGGAQQTLNKPAEPKQDFGMGPKPDMEFAPSASTKK